MIISGGHISIEKYIDNGTYLGSHVNDVVQDIKDRYPNFVVYHLHKDLSVISDYVASRIRVRFDNQNKVSSVTRG